MYNVIRRFIDTTDSDRVYKVGDSYPREGLTVSKERIESLLSGKNRYAEAFIEEKSVTPKKTKKLETGE